MRYVRGTHRPKLGVTPKDVVWRRGRAQLWRYHSDHVRYDPPVVIGVAPLDDVALLHPADDAGGAGDGHVEHVGEAGHREGAVGLEGREDVEMDQTQRSLEPRPERIHPIPG